MRRGLAAALLPLALGSCGAGGSTDGTEPFPFTDVTAAAGVALTMTSGGTPARQILEVKGGGLALLDADGDGDLDLFVPNGATLEAPEAGPGARLFLNEGGDELRFVDRTAEAGIELRRWGMGVAVGDVEGDGRDDLFVSCYGENALLRNAGGRFEDATAAARLGHRGWGTGCAFGDLDQDGDLDLYLVNYLEFDVAAPPPPAELLGVAVFTGPKGLVPQADVLYVNAGDGVFGDATAASGCAAAPASFGLGAVILDFDEDGRQDVFVGNDSMQNFLFAGRGGLRFENVGLSSGVACNADGESQATMGIAVGDVDGNGLADLFTTNFMGDTNTLHLNRGGMQFADRTLLHGLGMLSRPFLGWAAMFYDLEHDGDEDLVVFNGHVYPESIAAQLGSSHAQEVLVFAREGERFRRATSDAPDSWLSARHCDRSAAFGDLDGDGDVDCVVAQRRGSPVAGQRGDLHWQGRLAATLQGRRLRGQVGLRVRHRHRRLPGPQAGRRDRVLRHPEDRRTEPVARVADYRRLHDRAAPARCPISQRKATDPAPDQGSAAVALQHLRRRDDRARRSVAAERPGVGRGGARPGRDGAVVRDPSRGDRSAGSRPPGRDRTGLPPRRGRRIRGLGQELEMNHRARRVADIVRAELARALREDVRDPRIGFVTLTEVRMSPDLRHARIFAAVPAGSDRDAAMEGLRHAVPFLKRCLAGGAGLRYVPTLDFLYDDVLESGIRVDGLLEQVARERPPDEEEETEEDGGP